MFSFLKKKKADTTKGLVAHISGKVIPIEQVNVKHKNGKCNQNKRNYKYHR